MVLILYSIISSTLQHGLGSKDVCGTHPQLAVEWRRRGPAEVPTDVDAEAIIAHLGEGR